MEHPQILHEDEDVIAFLFLLTSSDQTEQLINELQDMQKYLETYIIYGKWDVLLKIKVKITTRITRFVYACCEKLKGIIKQYFNNTY